MPVASLTTETENAADAAVLLTRRIAAGLRKENAKQWRDDTGVDHVPMMAATLAAAMLHGNVRDPGSRHLTGGMVGR